MKANQTLSPIVSQTMETLQVVIEQEQLEPLNYEPFIYLLKHCKIILIDSGGIQEEAPALNNAGIGYARHYRTSRRRYLGHG